MSSFGFSTDSSQRSFQSERKQLQEGGNIKSYGLCAALLTLPLLHHCVHCHKGLTC